MDGIQGPLVYIVKVLIVAGIVWVLNKYLNKLQELNIIFGWIILGVAALLCISPLVDILRIAFHSS